jgi:hypothetical protein
LKRKSKPKKLEHAGFAVHEIRTTLACSEAQAKRLLAVYNGDSTKAIHEVKTGRAVLPGEEVSDLALYGGEFKAFQTEKGTFELATHDGRIDELDLSAKALLLVGVVDPEQRPGNDGLARADRGPTYGQLFWEKQGAWTRYLLNSSRVNYFVLGDKKENSAVRNFRSLVDELQTRAPNLTSDASVESLKADLRAPHYKKLADFEAVASQALRNWAEL